MQFLNLDNHTYQWVKPDGPWDASFLSREYCATLFRGFGAPGHALPKVEDQAEAFKRDRPDLPLDPESVWAPLTADA